MRPKLLDTHPRNRSFTSPAGAARSVLVVEDDRAVGTVLELVLHVAGHDVELADNVLTARRAIDSRTHDLILLDLHLPDGSGFDILRHVRKGLRRQTPVIVLSSARAEENRPRSLELGANDYITKPFSSEDVIARVRQLTHAGAA